MPKIETSNPTANMSPEQLEAMKASLAGDGATSRQFTQADRDIRMTEFLVTQEQNARKYNIASPVEWTPERVSIYNRAMAALENRVGQPLATLPRIEVPEPVPAPVPVVAQQPTVTAPVATQEVKAPAVAQGRGLLPGFGIGGLGTQPEDAATQQALLRQPPPVLEPGLAAPSRATGEPDELSLLEGEQSLPDDQDYLDGEVEEPSQKKLRLQQGNRYEELAKPYAGYGGDTTGGWMPAIQLLGDWLLGGDEELVVEEKENTPIYKVADGQPTSVQYTDDELEALYVNGNAPYGAVIYNEATGHMMFDPKVRAYNVTNVPEVLQRAMKNNAEFNTLRSIFDESTGGTTTKDNFYVPMIQTGGGQIGVDLDKAKRQLVAYYTQTALANARMKDLALSDDEIRQIAMDSYTEANRVLQGMIHANPYASFITLNPEEEVKDFTDLGILGPLFALTMPGGSGRFANKKGELYQGQSVEDLEESGLHFASRIGLMTLLASYFTDEEVRKAGWGSPEHIRRIRAGYDFGEEIGDFYNWAGEDAPHYVKALGLAPWVLGVVGDLDLATIASAGTGGVAKVVGKVAGATGLTRYLDDAMRLTDAAKARALTEEIDKATAELGATPTVEQTVDALKRIAAQDPSLKELIDAEVGAILSSVPDTLSRATKGVTTELDSLADRVATAKQQVIDSAAAIGKQDAVLRQGEVAARAAVAEAKYAADEIADVLADMEDGVAQFDEARKFLGVENLSEEDLYTTVADGLKAVEAATASRAKLKEMVPDADALDMLVGIRRTIMDLDANGVRGIEQIIENIPAGARKAFLQAIKNINPAVSDKVTTTAIDLQPKVLTGAKAQAAADEAASFADSIKAQKELLENQVAYSRKQLVKVYNETLAKVVKTKPARAAFNKEIRQAISSSKKAILLLPKMDFIRLTRSDTLSAVDDAKRFIVDRKKALEQARSELNKLTKALETREAAAIEAANKRVKFDRMVAKKDSKYLTDYNRVLKKLEHIDSVPTRLRDVMAARRLSLQSIVEKTATTEGVAILAAWKDSTMLRVTRFKLTSPKTWGDTVRYYSARYNEFGNGIVQKFGTVNDYTVGMARGLSSTFDKLNDEMTFLAKGDNAIEDLTNYVTSAEQMDIKYGKTIVNANVDPVTSPPPIGAGKRGHAVSNPALITKFLDLVALNVDNPNPISAVESMVDSLARAYFKRDTSPADKMVGAARNAMREFLPQLAENLRKGKITQREAFELLVEKQKKIAGMATGAVDPRTDFVQVITLRAIAYGGVFSDRIDRVLIDQSAYLDPKTFENLVNFQSRHFDKMKDIKGVADAFAFFGIPIPQRVIQTDVSANQSTKLVEVFSRLGSMTDEISNSIVYPAHLIAEFDNQAGLLIKDLELIEPLAKNRAVYSGFRAFLATWRRTIVLGVAPLVKTAHWVTEFWGSVTNMFVVNGPITASRVAFTTLPNFIPFGTKLTDQFAEMGGPGKLGSMFSSYLNTHTTKVFQGSREKVPGTNTTYLELSKLAMEYGLYDTFVHESLQSRMYKLSKNGTELDSGIMDLALDHLVNAQQRMRVALFSELVINRGMTPQAASREVLDALYDWKNPISNFEANTIAQVAAFYRFYRVALQQGMSVALQPLTLFNKPTLNPFEMYRQTDRYQRARILAQIQGDLPELLYTPDPNRQLTSYEQKLYLASKQEIYPGGFNYIGSTPMSMADRTKFAIEDGFNPNNTVWAQTSPQISILEFMSTAMTIPKALAHISLAGASSNHALPDEFVFNTVKPWINMLAPGPKEVLTAFFDSQSNSGMGNLMPIKGGDRVVFETIQNLAGMLGADYMSVDDLITYKIGEHGEKKAYVDPVVYAVAKALPPMSVVQNYAKAAHNVPEGPFAMKMAYFAKNMMGFGAQPYDPIQKAKGSARQRAYMLQQELKAAEEAAETATKQVEIKLNSF